MKKTTRKMNSDFEKRMNMTVDMYKRTVGSDDEEELEQHKTLNTNEGGGIFHDSVNPLKEQTQQSTQEIETNESKEEDGLLNDDEKLEQRFEFSKKSSPKTYEFPIIPSEIGMIKFVTSDFTKMMQDIISDFGLRYKGTIHADKYLIEISEDGAHEKERDESHQGNITHEEKTRLPTDNQHKRDEKESVEGPSYTVKIGDNNKCITLKVKEKGMSKQSLKKLAIKYYGVVKVSVINWDKIRYEEILI